MKITLRGLRELAGISQAELAKRLGVAQSEVSRLERRKDHYISGLRRYIEALGGELAVVIEVGEISYRVDEEEVVHE